MKVLLIYFRMNGRFFATGEYLTSQTELELIRKEVRILSKDRLLPNLERDQGEYIISVNVPEHKNSHPHLIIM